MQFCALARIACGDHRGRTNQAGQAGLARTFHQRRGPKGQGHGRQKRFLLVPFHREDHPAGGGFWFRLRAGLRSCLPNVCDSFRPMWRCDIACTSFAQQQVDWVVVSTLWGSGWCGSGDAASNSSDADRRGGNSSSDSSSVNDSDSSSSSTGLAHRRG